MKFKLVRVYCITIMCGLLRYMKTLNPNCPNFLDKKDNEFLSLHGAMDVVFHQLHTAGVGRDTKHARTLSKEYEQKLWQWSNGHNYTSSLTKCYFFHCRKDVLSKGI